MKCAITDCKTDHDRVKYCSTECAARANREASSRRYYRVSGFYQIHHKRTQPCLLCEEEFQPKNIGNIFCTTECAKAYRLGGETHPPPVVEKRKLEFTIPSPDGKSQRRNPTVTLVCGVAERGKRYVRPYVVRATPTAIEDAWTFLERELVFSEASGQLAGFYSYLMNLDGQ